MDKVFKWDLLRDYLIISIEFLFFFFFFSFSDLKL